MKRLNIKRYVMTDLGQALSLTYTLEKGSYGYTVTISSHYGTLQETVSAENLKLSFLRALRFFRMLIRDGVTPEALRDILESNQELEP